MNEDQDKHWLLLRGLSRESAHWGEFPALLAREFAPSSVHTLDLPGTGIYHRDVSPKSIPEILDQTRERALEKRLLSRPLYLVGVSLGGMVALEWLFQKPDEVAGAILINISLANVSPFYHRLRWQTYLDLLRIVGQRDVVKKETAILKLISNQNSFEEIAKEWTTIQTSRGVSSQNTINQLVAAARYRPQLIKPKPPVLLLSSRKDRLVSWRCSRRIARIMNVAIMEHPSAGHDLTLDDSRWVLRCIKDWLYASR